MVLRKRSKTGGGSGPAAPSWQNGRQAASEVSREHNVYGTAKMDITMGADAPTELRMGYHKLLSTLKDSNKTCVLLPLSPLITENSIVETDNILTKI